jgi:hypothetical protein
MELVQSLYAKCVKFCTKFHTHLLKKNPFPSKLVILTQNKTRAHLHTQQHTTISHTTQKQHTRCVLQPPHLLLLQPPYTKVRRMKK